MEKKIKLLTIGDMPLSPSGVGTQSKYICEALLKTGKFKIISLGGAVKHPKYDPIKTQEWGDDWVLFPVDGYGTQEMLRSIIRQEKPDILWFMTDPRFWGWLWQMENEIRPLLPMVYYHVWDNKPYPTFNKVFYDSNDMVVAISKVTADIVKTVSPDVKSVYLPHAVDNEIFKPIDDEELMSEVKKKVFGEYYDPNKFIFFWNSRNARRKQSGSTIFWFNDFLERVGKDKACLVMHTEVKDPHGQDLEAIVEHLGLKNGEVLFSQQKVDPGSLAKIYNMADCTICLSDAEGFGLSTMESLSCGTPIVVTMTGGLQEQVTNGKEWFGVGIEPASKAIIGSQDIPWIYEDRLNGKDVVDALEKIFFLSADERKDLGLKGRAHVLENYSFEEYNKKWVTLLSELHEREGSWETRNYSKRWDLKEVCA